MVLATQNPIELGGTFPLPRGAGRSLPAQASTGYLPADEEVAMLDRFQSGTPLTSLEPVTDAAEIKAAQEVCRDIYCDTTLKDYCVRIVRRTRDHRDVSLGSSPRGTLGLLHAGQARAAWRAETSSCPMTSRRSPQRARTPGDAPSQRELRA